MILPIRAKASAFCDPQDEVYSKDETECPICMEPYDGDEAYQGNYKDIFMPKHTLKG